MCSKTRYYNRDTVPGEIMNLITKDGLMAAHWGYAGPGSLQYNTKVEKLNNRQRKTSTAILEIEGFYEGSYFFYMPRNKPCKVAAIVRETKTGTEFTIVTRTARPPVTGVHDRMPVLIGDESAWLEKGHITPPDELLERVKQAA